ncbi:eukaryotic translation initiation factor 5B [Lucilia sericata]|uniref:eukaryotic translation initiation factor 5B n=1 Tax=Lucilia sericata TaxID=13632 RepID=UPI0018A84D30|nr:eukaryotic translation initiation factor 5B [Lucilia sericata]XP_037825764.1 eukaryotic translation initiation factor 5B [Lucilia sericata]XP_037825766.1 eukaryotic translation initiation factor 5B [Lucilia sericata]XP_037825767.1 eukaryotic translation initiation factor 5B [Lucilia sericata]XP_037825768.1 eukaryotic translation initiation factor 5B [Lucilia sericata]
MIIRRQLYSNNNKLPMKKVHDSGMELKPIYKKVAQPNKATTTSSTTIVRDVEDLLKPISQQKHHNDRDEMQQSQASKERTERNLWRNDEVMEMLYTMQQVKALEKLNDKTVKSENVFKDVEVIMHRNGFVKKSHVQIWTKWKFLKSTYMTSRRNRVIPRMVPPQIYETIHKMITGLNQSINDSCSSVDGDASSVSGMVISGVEGGVSDVGATNGEDEDSFGMAHPIFGFRLGTVKSEPEDTGYEAFENNGSDKDPLEEELSSSKSDKPVKEEDTNIETKPSKEPEPVPKVVEVPHRGRGRPPKNPPAATSTPNSTPSPATKPAQMPPLRVAPFAKAIHSSNAITPNRPPPPLTMPPTPRIRVANLSNLKSGEAVKFAQPKLIPKPTHHEQTPPQPVRLTKDISMQSRSSSTPSPSYPKMKQIPMRKTPYSLRPDRAIPDLEASLSPPPPAIEKTSNRRLEEVPTTKHLIMQNNSNILQNNVNRKRRLEWQDPLPGKQTKYNNSMYEERNSSKSFNNFDDGQSYGKVLQNVMIDLSSSLRKMQTEMMRDFFKKQNELLEREHKFQMQQDQMIMKAFQEQTQQIMHSVKQLVGSIKSNRNESSNEREEQVVKATSVNRKVRMQHKHVQEAEEEMEMEEDHIQAHEDEVEVEVEDDQDQEHEGEHEMEQDTEDVYTDGEEQQDQLEEHEENDQELMENNADEEEHDEAEEEDNEQSHEQEEGEEDGADEDQSQSADEQQENGLTAEEQDNSNDSNNEEENPLHIVASELNED